MLFFRDQDITPAEHLAFARRFGTISVAPFGPKHPDHGEITVLDQITPKGEGADNWHTDNTFMLRPPLGSILRAVQLPSVGGDTCFASMYAAYEALSPTLQAMLEPLRATHDLSRMLRKAIANGQAKEDVDSMQERWPPVTHPVIRTNPETGRKSLFINGQWAVFIEGLTERENAVLLPFLCDHVRSPGVPVPVPLGAQLDRLLGQPLGPALRRRRLHRAARHAAGHDRGRTPGLIG